MCDASCRRSRGRGTRRRVCVAIVACGLASAALQAAASTHTTQFEKTTYLDHIRYLASDDLNGRGLGEPGLDRAAEYVAEGFEAFGARPGGQDGTYFQPFEAQVRRGNGLLAWLFQSKKAGARNVIGLVPGAGPLAHQYVIVGAHYDHLGTRTAPASRDGKQLAPRLTVYNGADDNASGTAGLLELARHFGAYGREEGSRRSLLLIAFSAEEQGLLGSWHFVAHPTVPLDEVVAYVNLDMIGRMNGGPLNVYGTQTAREFPQLLRSASRRFGMALEMPLGAAGLSDHVPFYVSRIPVLHFYSGTHRDLHRPTDDTERINAPDAVRILDVVCRLTDDLLTAEAPPKFQAGSDMGRATAPSGATRHQATSKR
jgi:hypothetical protein